MNEPEIGSVSVCIPTVCFVESKLMDAGLKCHIDCYGHGFNPEK